jgi:regulator of protease activity HflC (stomatin/prohibitin superfamily)
MLAQIGFYLFVGFWFIKLCFYLGLKPYIIVDQGTVVVLQRWQKFFKVLEPGFHPLVPYLDYPLTVVWQYSEQSRSGKVTMKTHRSEVISTKECIFHLPYAEYYSKDGVVIGMGMTVNYIIKDAQKAVYKSDDLYQTMEQDLGEILQRVILALRCEEIEGAVIGKHMKSANGRDVWEEHGIKIGACRPVNLRLPPRIDDANTSTIEQANQHKSDIAMADVAFSSEMKQLELTAKLQEKEHDVRVGELRRELKLQEQRDELKQQKHANKLKRLSAYLSVIKGSGLPPEFFVQYADKKALKRIVSRGPDSPVSTIYVPNSLNAIPSTGHTGGGDTDYSSATCG